MADFQRDEEVESLQMLDADDSSSSQISDIKVKLPHHLADVSRVIKKKQFNKGQVKQLIKNNNVLMNELLQQIEPQADGGAMAVDKAAVAWKEILIQKLIDEKMNLNDAKAKEFAEKKAESTSKQIDFLVNKFVRDTSSFSRFEGTVTFEIDVKPKTITREAQESMRLSHYPNPMGNYYQPNTNLMAPPLVNGFYSTTPPPLRNSFFSSIPSPTYSSASYTLIPPANIRETYSKLLCLRALIFDIKMITNPVDLTITCKGLPVSHSIKARIKATIKNQTGQVAWTRGFSLTFFSSQPVLAISRIIGAEEYKDEHLGLLRGDKLRIELAVQTDELVDHRPSPKPLPFYAPI